MTIEGLGRLQRYRSLVDDWQAFREAVQRPLPIAIWSHPLRTTPAALAARLGSSAQPVAGRPGVFRLPPGDRPGNRIEFAAGLFHVQEEASQIPPHLLAPRSGERVLDLCAAPGNKTAQIALAMDNRGTVVANDRDRNRLGPLRRVLDRLGIANTVVVQRDAAGYPGASGYFDRVLADVPCSCEGTVRKSPEVLARQPDYQRLARVQRAILAAAVRLTRPGGRIVYSTCTFAPEENEAVIDWQLRRGGVSLVPAELAGYRLSSGLSEWQGQRFDSSLVRARRLWPHHNDTGGFFVAVLEKAATGAPFNGVAGPPPAVDPEPCLEVFGQRFGIPARAFEGYRLVAATQGRLALVPDDLELLEAPVPRGVGLPLLRSAMRPPKPTSAAALLLHSWATKNVVELDDRQADDFLRGGEPGLAEAALGACTDTGYVLVRFQGLGLGLGWLNRRSAGASLRSQLPAGWRWAPRRDLDSAFQIPSAAAEQ
ncbi:MAG: RsmB/NOP family class I SAM-dependent RNA methyltransferase [Acidobacteriota bacterium]